MDGERVGPGPIGPAGHGRRFVSVGHHSLAAMGFRRGCGQRFAGASAEGDRPSSATRHVRIDRVFRGILMLIHGLHQAEKGAMAKKTCMGHPANPGQLYLAFRVLSKRAKTEVGIQMPADLYVRRPDAEAA